MSPNLNEEFAQRVANRVNPLALQSDERPVGFDPLTIFTILCSLIGLAMQCWSTFSGAKHPADLHPLLTKECEDDHRKQRLIKRAARMYRRKSETKLTIAESLELARATVEEAMASDPNDMQIYAVACGKLSASDRNQVLNDEEIDE